MGGSAVNRFLNGKINTEQKTATEQKVDVPASEADTIERIKGKILSLVPKTGDTNSVILYIISLTVALLCITFILMSKKKDKK